MKTFSSLRQIGEWLGLSCKEGSVAGFAIDSRDVEKDFLFFALRGQTFDGHDFLQDVGKKGAIAAVVDRSYQGETGGIILLRVDDVTAALQTVAAKVQKSRHQRIVAVTGSVGKTTTKEFIVTLLSQKYSVAKTPGNSNSQVGLPLAILRATGEEEVFVVEMSMSELGHIKRLVAIAPPEIAVITKVGYSHVDTVPSGLEGVAAAKAEILAHPSIKSAVIEYEAFQFPVIQKTGSCKKITYGIDKAADMVFEPGVGLSFQGDPSPYFRLPFSETHFCENFAGAATVACLMGLSWEEILQGVRQLKAVECRFEKIERDGVMIINDSYNASPESIKAALDNLPKPAFGAKTIVVLGEMMALGKYSDEGHRIAGERVLAKADHLLCMGKRCMPIVEMFAAAGKPAEFFRNIQELKKTLFELSKPGDVVLIKGSNGNKLWTVLE
jgi:UDP-N-acetylmuramoyl-tripeptide--D-alanyl-D-alanine ligase